MESKGPDETYLAHAQHELNLYILRMFEGTFSFKGGPHIYMFQTGQTNLLVQKVVTKSLYILMTQQT